MAAIYLFSESLTTQQICAMHRLGPGYKVSEEHAANYDKLSVENAKKKTICRKNNKEEVEYHENNIMAMSKQRSCFCHNKCLCK